MIDVGMWTMGVGEAGTDEREGAYTHLLNTLFSRSMDVTGVYSNFQALRRPITFKEGATTQVYDEKYTTTNYYTRTKVYEYHACDEFGEVSSKKQKQVV